MAYTTNQALETLNRYLGITDDEKQIIENTKRRGFVFSLPNGEKAAVFVYPLVHKQDNTKNYFDTRDSGAYERGVTWNYAITNNMKYFCIGVNDTVDKYNDYSFSLECNESDIEKISGTLNGSRNGSGNQIIIPNDYVPSKGIERIANKLGIYITAVHKDNLLDSGEILWDKTINETFTFLSENRPYYIELQTRKRVTNDFDYFKRLHECLVTMASKELQDAALLDLFEMTGVDLTDEELDDFGDKEYILYRIENELNTQFNTRKQLVLKTMYAYIDRSGSLYDTECLSLFGTNSFNLVWEKICAEIMDNQLDVPLGILKLPVPLKEDYNRRQKLIELIEKPLWTITGKCAKDTLIPDLVSICKVNDQHQFIIFDAKYYNAHLEKGIVPTGQPGIESITKQYLYQLAYQQFIEDHNFSSVKNCFLLPTENNEIEDKGEVRMEMLSNLGLQDIKIRLIPATMAYDLYLSGSKMDMERLDL